MQGTCKRYKTMEKMRELTISDVKELTQGKRVTVSSMEDSAISVHMKDAAVVADQDSGADGKIIIIEPKSGNKIELDSDKTIKTIFGNTDNIKILFVNDIGVLDISFIADDVDTEDPVINQSELCQYIKDRLDRLSKLTTEDINTILDMEMEYMMSKGIVD